MLSEAFTEANRKLYTSSVSVSSLHVRVFSHPGRICSQHCEIWKKSGMSGLKHNLFFQFLIPGDTILRFYLHIALQGKEHKWGKEENELLPWPYLELFFTS